MPGVNSELAFYNVQAFKLNLDDIRSFLLSAALSWYSCDRCDHTFPSQVQSSAYFLECPSLMLCMTCKSQGDTVGRVKERMQERLGVNDKVRIA